jgi:UDP-glucose 4-epimerase
LTQRTRSLVTGGAGFIGSHISELLLERGDEVRVLDNLSTGKLENVRAAGSRHGERLRFVEGDIRDAVTLEKALDGADLVFHQAAMVSVQKSVEAPLEAHSVNLEGTLRVFEAARAAGVKKVVFASSTAVYGNSPELPKKEDMKLDPLSPYAATKYAGEIYGSIYSALYGLPVVCLRYFNVFGPRQDPTSEYAAVIPKFIARLLSGRPPVIYGDGEQTRDFVFVEDVARANLLAAASAATGVSVNIGSSRRYSLNELAAVLNQILGLDCKPIYEAPRQGEVRDSHADISLAGAAFGYSPRVGLEEGLRRTVEWFRKAGSA